jgi:hypothetical protein
MHFQRTIVVFTTLACQYALGQGPEASKGLPPRATPADYQAHVQAGKVTIAAEFDGHSIPDPQTILSTEDYVVVEVGLFGDPGSTLALNYQDFSARINNKKKVLLPAQPYALVFKSLKDPEYVPPGTLETKEKKQTSLNTGGGGSQNSAPDSLPPVIHIPIEVSRGWEQRVQKASLPQGDRPLPQAGLIFFEHHGKTDSIELIYNGPAGKATLALQ